MASFLHRPPTIAIRCRSDAERWGRRRRAVATTGTRGEGRSPPVVENNFVSAGIGIGLEGDGNDPLKGFIVVGVIVAATVFLPPI
jgi:hypothetical protein